MMGLFSGGMIGRLVMLNLLIIIDDCVIDEQWVVTELKFEPQRHKVTE